METRRLGKTDMSVSILGFGGSEIRDVTAATVEQLLGSALDAGLNVIDTGECYGASEELIGNAVSHRRNDYYLFTKCGHSSGLDLPDWDPAMLEQSIDRSLKRLKTDYLDLIQLHSCSEEILRQGDVIDVLRRARDAGKTRYIGYSGDSTNALYAIQCGAFDTLQTSINIADQQCVQLTLPEAVKHNLGVIAKRPIANAAWKAGVKPQDSYQHTYWDRLQQLNYDFLHADLDTSVGTALRFTLSLPGVHTAIVGTANPHRWKHNAELIAAGPLSTQQMEAIFSRWHEVANANWVGQG